MATDLTNLFNEALSIAGMRYSVSLPEENSREAEVCRLWYPTIRDYVQRAAPWPSNKSFSRLALASVSEGEQWQDTMPEPGYQFAYRGPAEMLYPRNLSTFDRFSLTVDNSGNQIINTNQPQAILVHSVRNDKIYSWDVSLRLAIAHALGAAICNPLSGRGRFAAEALAQANQKILEARQLVQNVGQDGIDWVPDWIMARGYTGGFTQTRYAYPFGPLLTMGNLSHA